eukprot:3611659-Rhodomonas_salina.2
MGGRTERRKKRWRRRRNETGEKMDSPRSRHSEWRKHSRSRDKPDSKQPATRTTRALVQLKQRLPCL